MCAVVSLDLESEIGDNCFMETRTDFRNALEKQTDAKSLRDTIRNEIVKYLRHEVDASQLPPELAALLQADAHASAAFAIAMDEDDSAVQAQTQRSGVDRRS